MPEDPDDPSSDLSSEPAGDATDAVLPAHRQAEWELRFDWGPDGLEAIGHGAVAVVVVDVLRFTTAVSVAVAAGAEILPYRWAVGDGPRAYAAHHGAELATRRREDGGWSLSPADLTGLPAGTRLVLPSPNGSAISFAARDEVPDAVVLAGCLRNAAAVAAVAGARPGAVAVVAAGERWLGSLGALRPAVEDLVGAGAVLRHLVDSGARSEKSASPEARSAMAAFDSARQDLSGWLAASASGRELGEPAHGDDIEVAARLDADRVAPVLRGPAFVAVAPGGAGGLR